MILNPNARGGRARRYQPYLDATIAEGALRITTDRNDARALAAEAVRRKFDVVVAAGGDGTVNEVLNGIGDEPEGFARVRLAVLPIGTANCFARELGVPRDCEQAWQVVLRGNETLIDLPAAEFGRDGQRERRLFVSVAGAGVDARAIELANRSLIRRSGYLAHILGAFQAVAGSTPVVAVTSALGTMRGDQVVVTNGRHYGGPFILSPDADLHDGQLDVSVLPHATWGAVARVAWGIVTNRLHRAAGIRHFKADAVTLTAPSRTPFELDGELVGELPATIGVQCRTLRVAVP